MKDLNKGISNISYNVLSLYQVVLLRLPPLVEKYYLNAPTFKSNNKPVEIHNIDRNEFNETKKNIGKMNTKTTLINSITNKFKLFPDDDIELYPPAEENNILWIEDRFQLKIPHEYKEFLKYSNGLYLYGYDFLGIVQGTDKV